jgi:SAM-dependent methyltransferase
MTSAIENTRMRYDDLPYHSYAYPHSAPEQLAAVASLFGLPAPDVATSRVLELGCASGGNLIPFALRNPDASAVGLDISGVQIAEGRDQIARLGAGNVILREADFLKVDPAELGEFDFIVAHGVYSWIPPEAQEAVLRIIARCLSPNGVAFVSYNTYPGWKAKEIVRDAMLMHGGVDRSASEQVAYGRSMLAFLQNVSLKGGLTAAALNESLPHIVGSPTYYVAHEFLEPFNLPCYFHEFVARIGTHRLAYLGEAQPAMMMPSNYGPELAQQLYGALGEDQVRVEQYLDFAISRTFRQTLVVHAERASTLRWQLDPQVVRGMHFSANPRSKDGPIKLDGQPQEFVAPPHTGSLTVGLSGLKQVLDLLARRWPGSATRDELVEYAQRTQGDKGLAAPEVLVEAIDELIEMLVLRGMARIRLAPVEIGDGLVADPVVRRQVAGVLPPPAHVANAWNDTVHIGDVERLLLPMMDGTADRAGLVAAVGKALGEGRLSGVQVAGSGPAAQAEAIVAEVLERMREEGLLLRQP